MIDRSSGAPVLSWRGHLPLLVLIACHAVAAVALWRSGSPAGTWQFECAVGALGWDLSHGLNPHYALSDYYDSWTSGYLLSGLLEAPLMALPWRPIVAVKATALIIQAATVGLAWLFLWRNVGPWAARVGAAALTFCPPVLWFYSLHAGDYHYTELLWAFAAACVVGEVVRRERRWGWYVGLGLVCGLAITNSFGSLAHVAVCLALVLLLAPGGRRPGRLASTAAGLLLGAGPILYKLLLHRPFDALATDGSYALPYTSGAWSLRLLRMKLRWLPEAFASHLGFGDGLHPLVEPGTGVMVGVAWTVVVVVGLVLVLVRARRDAMRLLLPLSLLGWLLAFCAVTSILMVRPYAVDEFLDARFLPPVVGLLAANLGVAAQVLLDARPGRRSGVIVGVVVGPLAAVCLLSWGGLFPSVDLTDGGLAYRGRCYDMLGMYASKHVEELPSEGPAVRWVEPDVCSGFAPDVRADCFLGRVMGAAMKRLDQVGLRRGDPASFAPPEDLVATCDALPPGWRRDCYRHAGWTLNWAALSHFNGRGIDNMLPFCRAFGPGPEVGWCQEGSGYQIAGHYAVLPGKVPGLLPDGPRAAEHVMRGFGVQLAHTYVEPTPAERLCASMELSEPLRRACAEGVTEGFSVHERPWPPWPDPTAASDDPRPDVVLVVIDTLRADRTSAIDPALPTTPRLARLGEGGVVFRQAVAPSSWTQPSIASLFTGLPIKALHFDSFDGMPTLADAFAEAGYRTVGRVSNPVLTARGGFARGFQAWDVATIAGLQGQSWRSEQLVDRALRDLDDGSGRPLFLYLHLMDPHEPYEVQRGRTPVLRAGWSGGGLADVEGGWARSLAPEALECVWGARSRYDAEVSAADAAVGRLVDGLDLYRPRPRVVAVTSDHGEGLFSHPGRDGDRRRPFPGHCDDLLPGRYRVHGEQRFDEAVRVPLWLAGPGVPAGQVEERQTEMTSLAGTLLRLAGIPTDRPGLPLGADQPASPQVFGADKVGWFVRTEELKLLVPFPDAEQGAARLFAVDGAGGAWELDDLSAERPDDRARLEAALQQWRESPSAAASPQQPGPSSLEPLRSLGYVE